MLAIQQPNVTSLMSDRNIAVVIQVLFETNKSVGDFAFNLTDPSLRISETNTSSKLMPVEQAISDVFAAPQNWHYI